LPLCMWHRMTKEPQWAIMQICWIFKQIYIKVCDPTSCHDLKLGVVLTLCHLKKVFPPSFFNLMTHLTFHIVDELDICGPIHSCWMYCRWRAPKSRGETHLRVPQSQVAESWDLEARSRLPTLERGRGSSWEPKD
jgi:hypothetical protein